MHLRLSVLGLLLSAASLSASALVKRGPDGFYPTSYDVEINKITAIGTPPAVRDFQNYDVEFSGELPNSPGKLIVLLENKDLIAVDIYPHE